MGGLNRAVAFRCRVDPLGRSSGRSAVRTAAYNARTQLTIDETGERADYSRGHSELTFSGIFAPKDAPDWLHVTADTDREEFNAVRARLWNEVEAIEDRKNSQLARALQVNLPHQLSQEGRERVLKDWVRENFVRKGMIADVNMHAPHDQGDDRNHHAHLLLTLRRCSAEGWDKHKARDWNNRGLAAEWSADLADKCARMLEREGHHLEGARWRTGHLDLPQQRAAALARGDLDYAEACNREPTKHRGPQITEMEARGVASEVTQRRNLEALSTSEIRVDLAALQAERAKIDHEIEREKAFQLRATRDQQSRRDLSQSVGDIRMCYAFSDSAGAFRGALADRGYWLARASLDDVGQSQFEAGRAESRGRWAPVLEAEQLVAVDTLGRAFSLGYKATGESREDVAAFLTQLDGEPLPSIGDLRDELKAPRLDYIDADRGGRGDQDAVVNHVPETTPEPERLAPIAVSIVSKVLDSVAREVESTIETVGDFIAPTAPTPERTRARVDEVQKQVARVEQQREIDVKRFVSDEDYRRQRAREEREKAEQRDRDYYNSRNRDRDR